MKINKNINLNAKGIYLLVNNESGMVYIGSTSVSFMRRLTQHEGLLHNNKHTNYNLQQAWNEYGSDAFEFFVAEYIEDVLILFDREQYWLDYHRIFTDVYNIKLDIDSDKFGAYRTEESIARQKESSKKYWSKPRLEHREYLRALRRGERWWRALNEGKEYKHRVDSKKYYDCSTDEGYWNAICDEYQRWMDGELYY